MCDPAHGGGERAAFPGQSVGEEFPEKPDVLEDVRDRIGLEVAVGHELEMRVDLLAVISGELLRHRATQRLAFDGALAVEGLAVREIE